MPQPHCIGKGDTISILPTADCKQRNKTKHDKLNKAIKTSILIVLINFKCYFKCVGSTFIVVFIYFHVFFYVLEHFIIEKISF